jgi:hemerythrin-like domain-containing protein
METSPERLSAQEILSAVSHLNLLELEQVFEHILALQAKRKAAHLSKEESALLSRANQGLSEDLSKRLTFLRAKREEEIISDQEYNELTKLTDQAEELHAGRMAALVELAKLRGVSLRMLMEQLGIHFPENV